jgi:hypothetical protein
MELVGVLIAVLILVLSVFQVILLTVAFFSQLADSLNHIHAFRVGLYKITY